MIEKEQNNTINASNILRKGGKLLGKYCPKCGGLLFKYEGRTICFNCDAITDIDEITKSSNIDSSIRIKNIISKKIETVINHLSSEEDIMKQMNLAELLLKYIEILNKIKKNETNEDENKVIK